jgi:hypothetical protein
MTALLPTADLAPWRAIPPGVRRSLFIEPTRDVDEHSPGEL